ncbi:MAG: sigma-70 family RNA polymerase sigma factor [Planctomycetota bacterium]
MESLEPFDRFPPPAELVERAIQHPDDVLGELFDRAHTAYWHLLTFRMDRRLMARVDAEDVLQEAYLATLKRISAWTREPKSSLFLWTRLTVLQTLIDVHRRHVGTDMRSASREVPLGAQTAVRTTAACLADCLSAGITSPSGVAIREESQAELQAAIESLGELDQEIIALRSFEGLSNAQAAEVLGLSVTAASNRYVRALERLQTALPGPIDKARDVQP